MTLPSSFPISASQINVELGRSAGAAFDIQGTDERNLAGIPAGAISMSDFLGKSIITVVAQVTDNGGGSPHTFAGVNFGPAQTDRWLIASTAMYGSNNTAMNISSVTIGGVTAAGNDSGGTGVSANAVGAGLFYANVPSGTSGNVVVNWSGQVALKMGLILISIPRLTFFDKFTPVGGSATSKSGSLNIPANGVLFGSCAHGGSIVAAWSGATARVSQFINGTGIEQTVAYDIRMGNETGRSVSANWSPDNALYGFELASFSQA